MRKLAWCTGGAQGFFQQAIDMGADAFVTGEISEAQYHLAQENGVLFVSAGHGTAATRVAAGMLVL